MRGLRVFLVAALALGLAGCAQKEPMLLHAKANSPTTGPDEFAIVPNRPLETPSDLTALPVPTPGSANLADANPTGDAIAALGGRAGAAQRVPANSALMARVSRFGVETGVRDHLAAEDLDFRKERKGLPLERLFKVNLYFDAYSEQSLDAYAEYIRLRRAGVALPVPPPEPPSAE